MNLYIGKLQSDGVIKYIVMHYESYFKNVPRILKTFYPRENRVDALLNLGNLVYLQPSPYHKWKGPDDNINCRAEIRDDKEKKGKHLPQYVENIEKYSHLDGWLFLYMNGQWYFETKDGFQDIRTTVPDFTDSPASFLGCEFYSLTDTGALQLEQVSQFISCKDALCRALKENKTYFIFRKTKFITAINHPLNR